MRSAAFALDRNPVLCSVLMPKAMRAPLLTLKFLLSTLAAVAVAYYAIGSINLSGLLPSNWTAADVIRQRCPVRLVRPEWVNGFDQRGILFDWAVTETKARLAAVSTLWVLAVSFFIWQHWRKTSHETKA